MTPVIGGEVDIVNLKLSLAGGFANYTTNAVLAATSFTAGSLEALARATAMAGLPSGAAASFAIEEGQDGKQYLNMALTDVQTLVIYVDEGTSNVTDNVIYPASAELQTIVAAGATLAISGNVGYGSLAHSGDGTLLLSSADNAFYGDVTSSGGTFSVSALAALSDDSVLPRETFTLTSGTLELSDSADPATFPRELVADAASASDAVVIKTDTGVTVEDATSLARTGAIVKRGAGKFTVTSAANPLAISAGNGIAAKNAYPTTSSTLTFGTDGKAGGTYYTGFTVAEGAAEFVGNGADALFSSSDNVAIGLPCSTGSADAGLTVRDAKLQANWMLLGCGLAAGNTFMTAPYLAATNATISADTFAAAYNSTLTALRPKVTLNASELNVSFLLRANHADNNTTIASAYDLAAGSLLATPRMGIVRKAEFDCDASTIAVTQLFCKAASYYEKNGSTYADSYGIFRLRNGSTLHTRDIEPSSSGSAASPLTFEFDDSEWIPTAGISADYAFSFTNAANLAIIATSGGLILSPGSELTWSVVHPVTGANGRIVKRGAGTLAFTGLNALAVGGTNEVEAGTFAVAATSVVASVKAHLASGTTLDLLGGTHVGAVVSGAGTVRNGALSAATVPVRLADGTTQETLTFAFDDGCSLAQSVTFDLGCSEDEPFEPGSSKVVLARYTGIVPDGIGWNLSNIGVRQKFGDFEFADGEIRAGLKNAQGTAIFLK